MGVVLEGEEVTCVVLVAGKLRSSRRVVTDTDVFNDRTHFTAGTLLCKIAQEGVEWIRGFRQSGTPEVMTMLAAYALSGEK